MVLSSSSSSGAECLSPATAVVASLHRAQVASHSSAKVTRPTRCCYELRVLLFQVRCILELFDRGKRNVQKLVNFGRVLRAPAISRACFARARLQLVGRLVWPCLGACEGWIQRFWEMQSVSEERKQKKRSNSARPCIPLQESPTSMNSFSSSPVLVLFYFFLSSSSSSGCAAPPPTAVNQRVRNVSTWHSMSRFRGRSAEHNSDLDEVMKSGLAMPSLERGDAANASLLNPGSIPLVPVKSRRWRHTVRRQSRLYIRPYHKQLQAAVLELQHWDWIPLWVSYLLLCVFLFEW